ncbi:cation:proton antiporter [Amorphus orientalis]|uniref:Multicomponent Na+:H+ antiporter subunit F n=1 Tax=Amorphus orientalis TaxID=649198 RepID=A0AAE3VN52_9HYPH|nr:cation:proton antiporter [Amorphus orientalis]MDQ0315107.1 multicomponent Na+:H+ antiporter subunit F [Amorphus orientalis]
MSAVSDFQQICVYVAFALLSLSFAVIVYRIVTGPTLPDRILALDMMIAVAIGFIATFGVHSGFYLYVDIAIALGLIGFLSTVAFARFVLARGSTEDVPEALEEESNS